MARTLVIGFGNPSRRDDGVGLAVVNGLRRRQGIAELQEGDDGFDGLGLGLEPDTIFLQQLTPELSETVAQYERLVLVDAHVATYADLIHRAAVLPQAHAASVSHHLTPGQLLALVTQLYGRDVSAELFSVRGSDFDFGTELSPDSAEGVRQLVEILWAEQPGGR
jgi:hydrogenase maturation protease